MKITFLGTRGYIDIRSRRHFRHTSTMIEYRGKRIMIDCGIDWTQKVWKINPDAIVITHAHPDHAFGLQYGSPCPVYGSKDSLALMKNYPLQKRHLMQPYKKVMIQGIKFETYPVVHSLRAPAVGYRIRTPKVTIFCVHDLISIDDRKNALHDVSLYIGDGATVLRPLVRRKGNKIFGHTTVRAQLGWCQKEHVPRMIVTHCGTQIVGDARKMGQIIRGLARERGVAVQIAYDGMQIHL